MIVVDQNIPFGTEAFSAFGPVVRLAGRNITQPDLKQAQALIVRSITKVDAKLLEGTPVKFVGTCTIGTDHLDIPWLEANGIAWTSAPGCNARSVAEYVGSALAAAHLARKIDLSQKLRAGVVGVGRVGTLVYKILEDLGLQVQGNDPPRQALGWTESVELQELIAHSDVVCAHLPKVLDGSWPTQKLLTGQVLQAMPTNALFLNAGRGSTADTASLATCLRSRPDLTAVLDVFDPEPQFPTDLANLAFLTTPHIAGYSWEGKVEGTRMVSTELAKFLNKQPWSPPPSDVAPINVAPMGLTPSTPTWDAIANVLLAAYDICEDSTKLKALMDQADTPRGQGFDLLRKEYPIRREWKHRPLVNHHLLPSPALDLLVRLGFPLA